MNPSSVNTYPTRHLSLMPSGPKPAPTNAAPPFCLTALEGVMRVADRKTDEFDAARAAIAKATGTTEAARTEFDDKLESEATA